MANLIQFQNCCGMYILWDLPGYAIVEAKDIYITDKPKHDSLVSMIKEKLKSCTSIGMVLAAVNQHQTDAGVGKVLEELGFRNMSDGEFFHPGHGRTIALYGLEIHPDKHKKYTREVYKCEEKLIAVEPVKPPPKPRFETLEPDPRGYWQPVPLDFAEPPRIRRRRVAIGPAEGDLDW